MQATLERGEQILVFLNRRGFSQFILCHSCGWVKKCDRCSISMTHYHKRNELKCHVCGLRAKVPTECETCHSSDIFGMGSGTESLEEDLKMVLTGATILRLDRDQITSQKRLEETLSDFREMKANILIGTQMLVKGHDFPKVTCVVVLSTDALLKWPDFRASERALQTLIQVSGRAGRAELPGHVYLQGYDMEHPVIKILTGEASHEDFVESEIELRKLLFYPPFSRFVRFRVEHENETAAKQFADKMGAEAKRFVGPEFESRIMGPSEALLYRAQNRYRFDLYFKAPTVDLLYKLSRKIKSLAQDADLTLIIDVDPYNS
jgi:primosomal protein N' (replication factor Y)